MEAHQIFLRWTPVWLISSSVGQPRRTQSNINENSLSSVAHLWWVLRKGCNLSIC